MSIDILLVEACLDVDVYRYECVYVQKACLVQRISENTLRLFASRFIASILSGFMRRQVAFLRDTRRNDI